MKLFFSLLAALFLFFSHAPQALANGVGDPACKNTALCRCIKYGECGRPRGYAACRVKFVAPTYGGRVTLDLRRPDGTSVFGKPRSPDRSRNGLVGEGVVTFTVGCGIVDQADLAYMCVEGADRSKDFVSIRYRSKGDFKSLRVEHCLLGRECGARFVEGPPPRL